MKTFTTLLASIALVQAAAVPQDAVPKPAHGGHGLGPFGIDLTFLQGIDLSFLAPAIARMQPYFKTVVESGTLSNLATRFIPTLKLETRTNLEPQIRKNAKRFKSRLGPLKLIGKGAKKPSPFSPGAFISLDPNGQSFVSMFDGKSICSNCTVLSGKTTLEFADGSPADPEHGVYIHHILSFDLSRTGVLTALPCDFNEFNLTANPINPLTPGAAFLGQGEDNGDAAIMFTTRDGKFDSGFQIGPDDKFLLQQDLVHYSEETKNIFVVFEFEYLDGHVGADAAGNLLSVTGCKLNEPKIDASGPAKTSSKYFPILVDGYIVGMKGHLHNGGEKMILKLNDQEICVSVAGYDDKNGINNMSSCDKPIRVKKGDLLSMDSIYDIVKHPMRKSNQGGSSGDIIGGHDLMAMWGFSIAVDNEKKAQ